MKHKTFKFFAASAIVVALSLYASTPSEAKLDFELNVGICKLSVHLEDGVMHCRCKRGGCYAGNGVSFRPLCGSGVSVNCTDNAISCKPKN